MTSNKNSNQFNDHPEMNDGYEFSNNNIPKTIQQLISMQGGNSTSIDINTRQFSKSHLSPINLSASIEFVVVSGSLGYDVGHMKSIGGL